MHRGGVAAAVLVMLLRGVIAGQQQEEQQKQQQGPLSCWSCSAITHGLSCYDLDHTNKSFVSTCDPEEVFCSVNRIWYVVEGASEVRNFSVNRTCVTGCTPSCVVLGDRTKIHSCTSCCTTSLCNVGSSASARPTASTPLVTVVAGVLVMWVQLSPAVPVVPWLPAG